MDSKTYLKEALKVEMAYDRKLDNYFQRTVTHIHRVQKNMLLLVTQYADILYLTGEDCRICMHNVMNHDRSKFSKIQFIPYVELTEFYRQRKVLMNKNYEYPNGVKAQVDEAVLDHYEQENHHPDKFLRDDGSIWAGSFNKYEILETACDLQAMAQEFDEGSCRKFFEKVWKKKHMKHFSDDCNWKEVMVWMKEAISCFEKELNRKQNDNL